MSMLSTTTVYTGHLLLLDVKSVVTITLSAGKIVVAEEGYTLTVLSPEKTELLMVTVSEAQSMTVTVNKAESPNKKFVYGEGQEVPLEHSTRKLNY